MMKAVKGIVAMTQTVYLVGYTGSKPERIQGLVQELDATLVDIRFSPRSRNPMWDQHALQAALGDRYVHCQALGNANYRGSGIKLVNFEEGKRLIEASSRPVILLCACKDPEECHRTVVGAKLQAAGFQVTELNALAKPKATQPTLWGGSL
jgi:uncharacterized protein (DUF488 family)